MYVYENHLSIQTAYIHVSSGHNSLVTSIAFSPDGFEVASGSNDNSIKIWNVSDLSDDVNHAYGVFYICDVKTLLGLHKVVVAIYPFYSPCIKYRWSD